MFDCAQHHALAPCSVQSQNRAARQLTRQGCPSGSLGSRPPPPPSQHPKAHLSDQMNCEWYCCRGDQNSYRRGKGL
jgi:hypothetical protein